MKKINKIILGVLLLALVSIVGCSSQTEPTQKVIAKYEGGEVTEAEFNTFLSVMSYFDPSIQEYLEQLDKEQEKELKTQILKMYIGEKYLFEQAEVDPSIEEKAKTNFEIVKEKKIQESGSKEKYNELLNNLKITESDLISYMNRYYTIENYFVEKEYSENREEFTVATVSQILVAINSDRNEEEAKKLAEEVLAKLKAGEDFGKLAKEYSDDPGSKDNGGIYRDARVAFWVPEFKEAVLALPLNEISGLVKTDYGYHIIKVIDRKILRIDELSDQDRALAYNSGFGKFIVEKLPNIISEINL
ncbi:hypothetical protein BHF71_05170 [Vulcanibacillus modesticaldus]|uniref:PpiC domain-containing protein n=1 Tax=Vulcanibacillus modesticaldus TaxID=337097 RepID=A0A1D2YXG3_9BACI|nr:peptidylprolyl isomerase [Vulcanibacillus modesticaldus]OEG00296.1 hypothetical protein BHF71_05170 [Vulcanibacillus modesticaldus]